MWMLLLVGRVAAFHPLFTTSVNSCILSEFVIVYASILSLLADVLDSGAGLIPGKHFEDFLRQHRSDREDSSLQAQNRSGGHQRS